MPGWEDLLSNDEREALVEYLKSFPGSSLPMRSRNRSISVAAPRGNADVVAEGESLYRDLAGCAACHGEEGRGRRRVLADTGR